MYTSPVLLIAALVVPAAFGFVAGTYLRGSLRQILSEICGNANRSDFWTRMAAVGFIIVPVALSLTRGPTVDSALTWAVIRDLLAVSVNGVLLVLFMLGIAMWRQLPRRDSRSSERVAP